MAKKTPTLNSFVVDTHVDNIKVTNACSIKQCRDKHVMLNGQSIGLHTTLKAKGKITAYNDIRQIELERAFIVRTTDQEVRVWKEYTVFCKQVLLRPWKLDKNELRKMERKDRESATKATVARNNRQDRERERERILERKRDKRRIEEAQKERIRQSESTILDGNALDRPRWKTRPEASRSRIGTKKP